MSYVLSYVKKYPTLIQPMYLRNEMPSSCLLSLTKFKTTERDTKSISNELTQAFSYFALHQLRSMHSIRSDGERMKLCVENHAAN